MANASVQKKSVKKNRGSDDFSVITGDSASFLHNTSWPTSVDVIPASTADAGPVLRSDEFHDSGQISASHYALATAYDRVSKKLAEAEKRNQHLRQEASLKDRFQVPRMSESSNYNLPSNFEDSVNQAWEAYNEKCKECQQLREELEDFKQRANNSTHFSMIQNLQEDVLREKAKQDDVVRKLEKTKMEADHLEEKEILAREELEKEREYLQTLKQSAEKRHREMEQSIEELQRALENEKNLTEELRRREKDTAKALEEDFLLKQGGFHSKIRDLEEFNISLKEEVAVLISMQTGASNSNGLNSRPVVNGPSTVSSSVSNESDANIASLEIEIQSLQLEMTELKKRANEQSLILSQLCQNPKLSTLFETIQQMSSSKSEYCAKQRHKLDTSGHEEMVLIRKKTNSPKLSKCLVNRKDHEDNCSSSNDLIDPTSVQDKQKHSSRTTDGGSSIMSTEEFIRSLTQDGLMKKNRLFRPSQLPQTAQHDPVLDVSRMIHTPESNGQSRNNLEDGSAQADGSHSRTHVAVLPNQPQCRSEPIIATSKSLVTGEKNEGRSPVGHGAENSHFYPYASFSSSENAVHSTPIPTMRSNIILADSSGKNRASSQVETPSNRYIGSSSDEDNTSDDAFTQLSPGSGDFHPKEFVVPKVVRRPPGPAVAVFPPSIWQEDRSDPRPAIRARAEPSTVTPQSSNRPRSGSGGVTERSLSSDSKLLSEEHAEKKCPICGTIFTADWTEVRMSFHINAHFSDEEETNNLMSFD